MQYMECCDISAPLVLLCTTAAAVAAFVSAGGNDLRAAATALAPEIEDVLSLAARAPDALAHGLSGSGATCFALFADTATARRQAMLWHHRHPGWWFRPGSAGGA